MFFRLHANRMKPKPGLWTLWLLVLASLYLGVKAKCGKGCDLALASYYVPEGTTLTTIGNLFGVGPDTIVNYNKAEVRNKDSVQSGIRINIPFSCGCVKDNVDEFLGHMFKYDVVTGDAYGLIVERYSNLTTIQLLQSSNTYDPNNIHVNATVNVTVKCFCGDSAISNKYGLFITYPLRPGDSLDSISQKTGLDKQLLQRYNVGRDFRNGNGSVFIPGKDLNGTYPPLKSSTGLAGGIIAGISVAAIAWVLSLALCVYLTFYRKKLEKRLLAASEDQSSHSGLDKDAESTASPAGVITRITVDKSVEFSYEELAKATDDFSIANKIGQGGFGSVYYAELRGEKAAIKKMDMQASREFLAELKVLTRIHHLNLVRLIGYCVEGSLCVVYEYIENGNLSQHLRGAGREPLTWSSRVQIALDSARALEYIHEHTVHVYIHRDIKPANILICKNFHGKVADFGLTKLAEVGSAPIPTRLVGTFGYMPPEYAQYGEVSPKVDVFAFGVVLYELISAKEAVVKADSSVSESKGLIALFEDVLNEPDPRDELCKLVDPRLQENYSLDAVQKMAQLAKACTHENPQVRPSMRSIVVALMALSSSTDGWDVGSFHENQALVNLMSGR